MNYKEFTTEQLLDSLPQNRPLYKDSGLWQFRTDDMENVYIAQNCNESFRDFVIRYIEFLSDFPEEINDIDLNLSLTKITLPTP